MVQVPEDCWGGFDAADRSAVPHHGRRSSGYGMSSARHQSAPHSSSDGPTRHAGIGASKFARSIRSPRGTIAW
jgi:hypothetical protein